VTDGVDLRPAGTADEALLLRWRHDDAVVRQSFTGAPPTPEHHAGWLRDTLARPDETRLYIAERDGRPVGQARVDSVSATLGEISVSLAAEARGRRLAPELIALASERGANDLGLSEIRAMVRSDNVRSRRAFEAAGYGDPVEEVRNGVAAIAYRWVATPRSA
jgi:UDP-2,4-diacetamido-2,4,6-trideoxy-beta-L-altropyranose hydrolase